MNDLEALLRQITINIAEVYDASGNQIVGWKATADFFDVNRLEVTRMGPLDSKEAVAELLGQLAELLMRTAGSDVAEWMPGR